MIWNRWAVVTDEFSAFADLYEMPFISITRLKVRSIFNLISFLRSNEASVKQLISTKDFIAGKELVDKGLTFWTLTIWDNESGMREFRNSIPHREAMQSLPDLCSEAAYFHWTQENSNFPDWTTASVRLIQEGHLTKVRKPSPRQLSKKFPAIRWTKLERDFKPK